MAFQRAQPQGKMYKAARRRYLLPLRRETQNPLKRMLMSGEGMPTSGKAGSRQGDGGFGNGSGGGGGQVGILGRKSIE